MWASGKLINICNNLSFNKLYLLLGYVLDRWFSAGTGRPLTVFDEVFQLDCSRKQLTNYAHIGL